MSEPEDTEGTGVTVRIYKMTNALKARLGAAFKNQPEGFLDPEKIVEADKVITDMCLDCPEAIERNLLALNALWSKMRDMQDTPERTELSRQIFTAAHEIKDVGAMCGYELISHFAESLRDYIIGHTKLNIQAQIVIIQAHLDAMMTVHGKGYKKEADAETEELKAMVKKAIEKYS